MIITFLGTSAANAFPEAFCRCPRCEQARALGGPSLRKRSSVLINADLLIDLGPDIETASQWHGVSLANVKYCLQTHPHADHMDLSHLLSRSPGFGTVGAPCLHFYASQETMQKGAETFVRDLEGYSLLSPEAEARLNLKLHVVEPFQTVAAGGYRVTPFPASHAPGMGALLYAVEEDGKCVFYGADTAALSEETWQAFRSLKMRFDVVMLDHTYGPDQIPPDAHMSAQHVIECIRRMREEGILAKSGRVYATHIAHEGNPPHPELVDFARRHGYEVAYDGLVVEV